MTGTDWERCSAGLAELLEQEASAAEELRRLTPAVLDAASTAGLFSMVVPGGRGGADVELSTLIDVTRTLARGCPASAWTLSFLTMHNWLLTRFPERLQDEVFATPPGYGLVAAPLAPTGTAQRTTGPNGANGWLVTGRWEWATGVRHADRVMVTCVEDRKDALALRFCVLPIDQVAVEDVWFTSGMRATGSDTVVVDSVFVADYATLPAEQLLEGAAASAPEGAGLAHLPVMAVLALVAAAPAVGAAERAVDEYRERLRGRVLAYTFGDKAAEQPAAQVRLGTALADVRAARRALDDAVDRLTDLTGRRSGDGSDGSSDGSDGSGDGSDGSSDGSDGSSDGSDGSSDDGGRGSGDGSADDVSHAATRIAVRLAAADAVRRSVAVISDVCAGSGASVYRSDAVLQRLQRDVEVLKGHVMFDWDRTAELAGRIELGLPLRPADRI